MKLTDNVRYNINMLQRKPSKAVCDNALNELLTELAGVDLDQSIVDKISPSIGKLAKFFEGTMKQKAKTDLLGWCGLAINTKPGERKLCKHIHVLENGDCFASDGRMILIAKGLKPDEPVGTLLKSNGDTVGIDVVPTYVKGSKAIADRCKERVEIDIYTYSGLGEGKVVYVKFKSDNTIYTYNAYLFDICAQAGYWNAHIERLEDGVGAVLKCESNSRMAILMSHRVNNK